MAVRRGIHEYYAGLLGMSADASVIGFMRLLARKNRPKGHEACPCNSGERLRNCHRDLLYKMRECVAWQDVAHDLEVLVRSNGTRWGHLSSRTAQSFNVPISLRRTAIMSTGFRVSVSRSAVGLGSDEDTQNHQFLPHHFEKNDKENVRVLRMSSRFRGLPLTSS